MNVEANSWANLLLADTVGDTLRNRRIACGCRGRHSQFAAVDGDTSQIRTARANCDIEPVLAP
jgi:hypothetical protein